MGERGAQEPVIIVEPVAGKYPRGRREAGFREELLELGRANDLTRTIGRVLFQRSLPVDVRHNAKINRGALAGWAAGRSRR